MQIYNLQVLRRLKGQKRNLKSCINLVLRTSSIVLNIQFLCYCTIKTLFLFASPIIAKADTLNVFTKFYLSFSFRCFCQSLLANVALSLGRKFTTHQYTFTSNWYYKFSCNSYCFTTPTANATYVKWHSG